MYFLTHRHVETTLLYFVLDVAALLFAHVTKNLTKHPFQRVVLHHATPRTIRVANGLVTVITDVKSCAIQVTGVLCGIAVALA